MLPVNTRGMWIGTFHGLCNRLLRAHYREAGLPQPFQILDSADQLSAVKRLMKNLNVDDEKFPPRELCQVHQRAQGGGPARRAGRGLRRLHADAASSSTPSYEDAVPARRRGRFRRTAAAHLRIAAAQRAAARALPGALPAHPGRRVPGHQQAAIRLAEAARRPGGSQGVCSRSATTTSASTPSAAPRSATWRDFEREFAATNVIRLEQNYRSHGNILDAANALIKNNRERLGKNLWTDAGAGEPIRVLRGAIRDIDEARFIVEEVAANWCATACRATQIALLYRSNAQSRVLEHAAVQRRRALSRLWRPALLRARRDQARAGLPAPARQPGRRHRLSCAS